MSAVEATRGCKCGARVLVQFSKATSRGKQGHVTECNSLSTAVIVARTRLNRICGASCFTFAEALPRLTLLPQSAKAQLKTHYGS